MDRREQSSELFDVLEAATKLVKDSVVRSPVDSPDISLYNAPDMFESACHRWRAETEARAHRIHEHQIRITKQRVRILYPGARSFFHALRTEAAELLPTGGDPRRQFPGRIRARRRGGFGVHPGRQPGGGGAVAPDASESAATGPPGAFDGPELRPLAERCLLGFGSTSGPPTLPNYFYNNLKQIVQTKDTVLILNEMVHDARVVRMNAEHLPATIRKWNGDSIGHWDGDTLVVDTTNFTGKTRFNGSGDQLHVVERFTRVDPKTVLYRFIVEDPTTWERAWTGEYPWRVTDEKLYEYACHEGNYSLGGMLRGARQKEAEDAAKTGKQ